MTKIAKDHLPALRRYGALLLGSKRSADDHLERVLADADVEGIRTAQDLYRQFHLPALPAPRLDLDDFAEGDRRLLLTLHKLPLGDRALLLLTSMAALDGESVAEILQKQAVDIPVRLANARSLMRAGYSNRLCMIVEDDLIALRDLEAELLHERLGVAGTAKNRAEALGLTDSIRPDLALIDLALPEGATAGADVAARLRQRFRTRIIFVTAFVDIAARLAGPGDSIVPKPWSQKSLKQALAVATS